jgi:hypothetical protein
VRGLDVGVDVEEGLHEAKNMEPCKHVQGKNMEPCKQTAQTNQSTNTHDISRPLKT